MTSQKVLECVMPELTSGYRSTAIATCVLTVPLSFVAAFGNLMVIIAMLKDKRIQSQSNILLGGLCMTDLLVGWIGQPVYVARRILELKNLFGTAYCTVMELHIYFAYLGVGSSATIMGLISLDRWYAICRPFAYHKHERKRQYLGLIGATFILFAFLLTLPFMGIDYVAVFIGASVVVVASTLTIVICYINIYVVLLKHKKSIAAQEVSQAGNTIERKRRPAERKRTNTIAIILAVLFVCYAPHVFLICFKAVTKRKLEIASRWGEVFAMMNSSINPIIYCLRSTEIRNAVKALFRKGNLTDDIYR